MDESVVKQLEQQADLRAIFERVKAHLLAQGCQSKDADDECSYRGADGLKCAVGVLIEGRYYSTRLEGYGASNPNVVHSLALSGVGVGPLQLQLLNRLQSMHDRALPETWPSQLAIIERWYFGAERSA